MNNFMDTVGGQEFIGRTEMHFADQDEILKKIQKALEESNEIHKREMEALDRIAEALEKRR